MNFLLITTKFPVEPGDSWLQTDLAAELVRNGHSVDVAAFDWDLPPNSPDFEVTTDYGAHVYLYPPRAIKGWGTLVHRASKWLLTPWLAGKAAGRSIDIARYDAIVATSPCAAVAGILAQAARKSDAAKVLYVYDFFPIGHAEVGLVPGGPILAALKRWEEHLMRDFDVIFCNLPGNIDYLRRNYKLEVGQEVRWTPLWTISNSMPPADRAAIKRSFNLPQDRAIAVFGGQLVEGRGIEQILRVASRARDLPLAVLFVGDGRLSPLVEAAIAAGDPVKHIRRVPREDYLKILQGCDIGLAVTVSQLSTFSFPTKSLDYLRAGLPVVISVEKGNDISRILEQRGVGLSVDLDDDDGMLAAMTKLVDDESLRQTMSARAAACVDEVFDVRHGYRRLIEAIDSIPVRKSA